MTTHHRISIDAHVCHGKPVIRGTRVPVAIVVGSLAGGMSFEEIEAEYAVTREDVQAALAFAGELVSEESFHPLPGAAWGSCSTPQHAAIRCGSADEPGPRRGACGRLVMLSYFVEPNPSSRNVAGQYSYASRQLRFDVKRALESLDDFRKRIDLEARDAEQGGNATSSAPQARRPTAGRNPHRSS
jgi:uncharacterized protein (DUF433 family)